MHRAGILSLFGVPLVVIVRLCSRTFFEAGSGDRSIKMHELEYVVAPPNLYGLNRLAVKLNDMKGSGDIVDWHLGRWANARHRYVGYASFMDVGLARVGGERGIRLGAFSLTPVGTTRRSQQLFIV